MKNIGFSKVYYWNTGGALVSTTVTTTPQTSSTWNTSRATSTSFTTAKTVAYTSWNTSTTFNTTGSYSRSTTRSTSRSTYYYGSRNTTASRSTTHSYSQSESRSTSQQESYTSTWTTFWSTSYTYTTTYNTSANYITYFNTNRFTEGSGGRNQYCVVEGTNILKADGSEELVENIAVGDEVMSVAGNFNTHDPHELHNFSQNYVVPLITEPTSVIKNELHTDSNIYNFNDGLLLTTSTHYHLFKRDDKWIIRPAYVIEVGDKFINKDGEEVEITSVELMEGEYNIYHMDTEPGDVFFANGILTHNQLHQHIYE